MAGGMHHLIIEPKRNCQGQWKPMYGFRKQNDKHEGPALRGMGFMPKTICNAQEIGKGCPIRQGHQILQDVK